MWRTVTRTRAAPHRVATCSDAAHTVHPLAGQGLNLGIGDAEALAQAVRRAVEIGDDVGASTTLREYERTRAAHNLAIMSGLDLIKRFFLSRIDGHYGALPSVVLRPWVSARNLGLAAVHAMQPLKSTLARVAMGSAP